MDGNHSTNGDQSTISLDLRSIAAATAIVIAMAGIAALAYLLIDILLLFFIGIVVAAALAPWHAKLCRWNIPRGISVLLIYLLLLLTMAGIALVVGPVLIEQLGRFVAEIPQTYDNTRKYLLENASPVLHFFAQRLPPFERLTRLATDVAPRSFADVATSVLSLPAYFISVLAIAFYWTLEVPQLERLVLSLIDVEKRPRALNMWHEIEYKLGGFIRGQGLAMLAIGTGSAIGYLLIGLPNVLALAVLAGLLEAVPLIGPTLAVVPAVIVALPMGFNSALAVVALAGLLQFVENNVLIPRIMHRAVGVSDLVSLLAVLAFGTLYGIVGVLIAIPIAAVVQVLLDTLVINAEFAPEPDGIADSPWNELRARVASIGEHARVRLRSRTSRMGIDPSTIDHVIDSVDQQIEMASERAEKVIEVTEEASRSLDSRTQKTIREKLHEATARMEQAVMLVEKVSAIDSDDDGEMEHVLAAANHASQSSAQAPANPGAQPDGDDDHEALLDDLEQAAQRLREAVEEIEVFVVDAAHAAGQHPPPS